LSLVSPFSEEFWLVSSFELLFPEEERTFLVYRFVEIAESFVTVLPNVTSSSSPAAFF
jgi:hypothetical protein